MTLYKVLDGNGCSCNGGDMQWSLPTQNDDGTWTPGEWMPEIEGPLVKRKNGYHLATLEQLVEWFDARIFVAEVEGDCVESSEHDKWVARKVRLVSETAWDERTARLFACDCAEHVLYLYEQDYPDDTRPRQAIETARKYANGKATLEELAAAGYAARAAAGYAAWDVARDAARDAAGYAARAAAGYAAWDVEREWQIARLKEYFGVR